MAGTTAGAARTPQVVAHRGASFENAEHTLGAYLVAIEAGADALECDVRLTADGHLVCVHDRTLRRTASTRGVVSTMALDDLNELDFAAWKNPWARLEPDPTQDPMQEPDRDEDLDGVLTLRRLLETVADVGRRVEVAIETKHPTRYGGLVEKRLAEMLTDFGWDTGDAPVRVMSFSFTALQRMERLSPRVRLVQLVDRPNYWPMLRRVLAPDWIVGPGVTMLREHPQLAARIAASGHEMHVWTVNTDADLAMCRALGVTAVITDRPAYLLEKLGR